LGVELEPLVSSGFYNNCECGHLTEFSPENNKNKGNVRHALAVGEIREIQVIGKSDVENIQEVGISLPANLVLAA
jgi:hypothetical protein